MYGRPSTRSIAWPGSFFAGQSLLSSTAPSALEASTEAVEDVWGVPVAVFHATVNSTGEELRLWVEGAGQSAVKRMVGCALLVAVPDDGLDEALEALKDIIEFRCGTLTWAARALPSPPRVGHLVGRVRRPDLVVAE